MATNRLAAVLRRLRGRGAECAAGVSDDGQLLERFVRQRDEEAFGTLVARHGPMVLDVCRRVLFDQAAAEDAFQATFLVLIRKAGSIRKGQLLGNWLYGVAYRTASHAKVEAARRRARESTAPTPANQTDLLVDMTVREFMAALDDELSRLPARYRTSLVLCYLEGRTRDEAARELGCSLATLDRWLKAGRELLRSRLTARGLTMSGVLLGAVLCERAGTASVPAALMSAIVKLAAGSAARTEVAALTEEVLKAMTVKKQTTIAVLLALAAMLGAGTGKLAFRKGTVGGSETPVTSTHDPSGPGAGEPDQKEPAAGQEKLQGTWAAASGGKRPADFTAKPGAGRELLVVQRPEAQKEKPALEDLPDLQNYRVDPYIRAAAVLQDLGQEKAADALLKLAKGHDHDNQVIVLCRMLFTPKPKGEFRRPAIGAALFLGGTDYPDWPLEPIELVDGVPFLIARGYALEGRAEPAEAYVKYCLQKCDWNSFRFKPKNEQDKQKALEKFLASSKWKVRLRDADKEFLSAQIRPGAKKPEDKEAAMLC